MHQKATKSQILNPVVDDLDLLYPEDIGIGRVKRDCYEIL